MLHEVPGVHEQKTILLVNDQVQLQGTIAKQQKLDTLQKSQI